MLEIKTENFKTQEHTNTHSLAVGMMNHYVI